jgi:CBS domain-containing protein
MRVGDLASRVIVSVAPSASVREAARTMSGAGVGSAIVLDGPRLAGIVTERDVLGAVAGPADLDETEVAKVMTRDVVVVGPDWEIYEAAAEMAARHIRHLVVGEHGLVLGVVSVRDLLLAGQRVELGNGQWAQLRDSLTFSIRERRKLQRFLLALRGVPVGEADLAALTGLLVGSWSLDLPLPPETVPGKEYAAEFEVLRDAVLAELPELQRAVHPAPGWRRR